jgi:flagella basal body P-ring formation protein FlgA
VSTDGQALNSASEGQMVKVKINSGQVLSGTAKAGGIVEVNN